MGKNHRRREWEIEIRRQTHIEAEITFKQMSAQEASLFQGNNSEFHAGSVGACGKAGQ